MSAYITATGRFLPGDPVPNNEIEDYLGSVGRASSALRERTLENCGIKTRYYAIDKKQQTVVSNAEMAAAAVRAAVERAGLGGDDIELLTAATTVGDVIAPGFASMVHGELGYGPLEIATAQGICSSGMMALKNAYLQVAIGEKRTAVTVASELASRGLKSSRYQELDSDRGAIPMEAAFLRYMLSDGAGAAVIQDRPAASGVSLRIDWITLTSYANTEKTCMFIGTGDSTVVKSWMDYPATADAAADGALHLRQRLTMLPHLVRVGVDEYERLCDMGKFDPEQVTWFPAHYSSERMKTILLDELERRGIWAGRPEMWFSNLTRVGNIGSASIFVILDEMMTEGMIEPGDTLLCMVPESGRFAVSFMHLTAVSAPDAG
ncbi:3-oxoacyl-[acyl-carrier-protein] synthase III C-terminal domain-containing protein [Nocardia sp. NPDC059239]|uniref:3-oxoacyl-[acyl-carrier-protein] synthase III C-terminal domain-containing protein n=1 Tax=unclassified Nocardia TaxID=2637762 RepID=UPI0036977251